MPRSVGESGKPLPRVIKDDDQSLRVIKRQPPRKMHPLIRGDEVTLNRRKSEVFPEGETYTIKNITRRDPNTVQLIDGEGKTTFVSYFDLDFESEAELKVQRGGGVDNPISTRYIRWP